MASRVGRLLLPALSVGLGMVPFLLLAGGAGQAVAAIDAGSLRQSFLFALGGAAVSVLAGAVFALVIGTHEFYGRRIASLLLAVPIAAPPAFWWLGFSRLPGLPSSHMTHGLPAASLVAGLALSPIAFLLVLAAIREIPTAAYEAARVSLPPFLRLRWILVPLIRSSVVSALLLASILLLAESEIPFLFGFRTTMTDIITEFSRTFDASGIAAPSTTLALVVIILAILLSRPLLRTLLLLPRGGRGVVRRRSLWAGAFVVAAIVFILSPLIGYAWPLLRGPARNGGLPVDFATVVVSIGEPTLVALVALALGVAAAYPLRESGVMHLLLVGGLLVFCIPSAINAVGWIGVGQILGVAPPPAALVQILRLWGVGAIGFAAAYARLPRSLEAAARLIEPSAARRAWTFVLPVLAPSLAATSLLAAAIVYSDRDVASLLLPPGAERLTLDLYLASANAPARTVGSLGLLVFAAAIGTATLASAIPFAVLRRRG